MTVSVSDIKTSMRITHNCLDTDIQNNIGVCLLDMARVGVDTTNITMMTQKACELYCKWQYDYQGKSDQYFKAYNDLRDSMSLCIDYKEVPDA